MYTLLLVLIYIAFISLGLPDSLLGSGWPVMHGDLQVPVSYMGIVTMIISAGTVVSSLCSYRLTKKLGTPVVTVGSVFLTAVALLGFSFANQFWMLLVLAVPYGLGAGAIDAALNNYVALHYTSRHMSWLHCFWGVGTIVSPFVMSWSLTNSSWHTGYRTIGFIQLGIAVLLLLTLRVWKVNPPKEDTSAQAKGLISALKIRGVPALLLGFLSYCAAEATTMSWASTYLVESKGISAERAAQFASLFFIGITAGRFLGGFLMNKLGDWKMIVLGTVILACGVAALVLPVPGEVLPLAGLVTIGLGCAPIYPCIIHATPANFGPENSAAIIGIQMASAYVGSTFGPPLFGLLGNHVSFGLFPLYVAAFAALMVCMTGTAFRLARGDKGSEKGRE